MKKMFGSRRKHPGSLKLKETHNFGGTGDENVIKKCNETTFFALSCNVLPLLIILLKELSKYIGIQLVNNTIKQSTYQ
jgi:hypothetical protein